MSMKTGLDIANKKNNIVFVSEEYPPFTPGGIATYQKTLAEKLVNTKELGNITVICKAIGDIKEGVIYENGVKIIRIKPYFENCGLIFKTIGYKLKVLTTLLKERRRNKIDKIESPEWNQELFFYYIYNILTFNKKENKKIILRLHTPLFLTKELNNLENSIVNRISIIMEKFLIDNVQNITSCSQSLVNEMSKYHKMRKDIKIIHNLGNDKLFNKNKVFEDKFRLRKKGKINILFAGSLEYRKGIKFFCEAMKKILDKNFNVEIILAGKYGKSENANSKLSKNEVLSFFNKKDKNRIKFLGLVPYEEMPNVYKHVDICIFPSIYDNYPGVVLESLLMGKAVICSKNTGIIEAIKDGIIYIDPTNIDEIVKNTQKLIDDIRIRIKLGEKGAKNVKILNNKIIKEFILYYNK